MSRAERVAAGTAFHRDQLLTAAVCTVASPADLPEVVLILGNVPYILDVDTALALGAGLEDAAIRVHRANTRWEATP